MHDYVSAGRVQVIPSVFVPAIERAVQEFVAKWQDRDESMNFAQRYDPDLVKDELRPLVFEELRLQVDEEMRILLENLKVRLPGPHHGWTQCVHRCSMHSRSSSVFGRPTFTQSHGWECDGSCRDVGCPAVPAVS